ncbi:hypothetical protein ACIPC1_03125 [Streptomyces sp. NPDC087263]|uniref:hypothetical protein n=1 Tax=Streptomyces sp. NPDC087263 TaxID=3365773 RepID=UPI0037FBEF23
MSESPTLAETLARLDARFAEKGLHRGEALGVRAMPVAYLVESGTPLSASFHGERR